jgi:hypothetical protein
MIVKRVTFKGEPYFVSQSLATAEMFSVDGQLWAKLSTYVEGETPPAGYFFCKAYSENEELVDELIRQGALVVRPEPILLPPYGARVYIARVNADPEPEQ